MKSYQGTRAETLGNAIPIKRIASEELPPVVRDLADLLAEIAARRIKNLYPTAPNGQEKYHD